ncbi:uncharacterized protein [Dysidea avara]|uniref:uncharacterized protein n=1 Tax=Dysidea avara TaxID=196820 RepID=UPI003326728D
MFSTRLRIIYIVPFIIFLSMLIGVIYYIQDDSMTYGEVRREEISIHGEARRWQAERTSTKHSSHNLHFNSKLHIGSKNTQGYILPFRVMEQQTAAIRNLYSLQYWASTVNMKVVEPYISNETFDFFPFVKGDPNPMAFSDLYDRDFYNRQSTKYGHAELVTWEEFLTGSPKNTILVLPCGKRCSHAAGHSEYNDGFVSIVTNPDRIEGTQMNDKTKLPVQAIKFFKNLGFHFIREVNIVFSSTTPMPMQTFTHHVLGSYAPNDVTVIIALWQGITKHRDNLDAKEEQSHSKIFEVGLLPSTSMIQLSETYLKKTNPNGEKYFGVMVRTEKVLRPRYSHNKEDVVHYMMECAEKLKQHFNVHPTWSRTLAIDLGDFGTIRYRQSPNENVNLLYKAFVTSVYNESWSINKFENIFEDVVNPVIVAQLQRIIAAKSDCLVLIGGPSSFQSAALSMYKIFHPVEQEQCIIQHCYYGVNFDVSS